MCDRIFLGTDSAPHAIEKKESGCGCAGIFSAPVGIESYAQTFDELGCLLREEIVRMQANPEAYADGVIGLKLELKCRQQLMRGEITIDDVKTLFFAHFDSCAQIVRDAQAQRLTERFQAEGFNILCP